MKLLKSGIRLNDTGKELVIGNLIYFIICEIIILAFVSQKWYCTIGLVIGVFISVFMIIHMTIAMEQAMCLNERGADKHIRKTTAARMLVVFGMMVLAGIADVGNIVATVAGVMALKVSAYIQPFTHRIFNKLKEGR